MSSIFFFFFISLVLFRDSALRTGALELRVSEVGGGVDEDDLGVSFRILPRPAGATSAINHPFLEDSLAFQRGNVAMRFLCNQNAHKHRKHR